MNTPQPTVRRLLGMMTVGVLVSVPALSACGGTAGGGAGGQAASTSRSVSSAPLWAAPGDGALPPKTVAALQLALDGWVAATHLVGVSAAVVAAAGTWSGAAGVDGAGVRVRSTSAMGIASVTKTFVAAEVVQLASLGLVNLDAPLADYISIPFDAKGATVRQALAMRSGFPEFTGADYMTALAADLHREWTTADDLALIPANATGTGALGGVPSYTNTNYVLLGELIAKVTGLPLGQALHRDLIGPAGLSRTWVQTAETPTAPLTVAKDVPGVKVVDRAGPYLPSRAAASSEGGCGAIASDAADVARWGYLLYGGHVIDATLVKQMEADPQTEAVKGLYALGTVLTTDDHGTTMIGHAGGGPEWPYSAIMMVWTGNPAVAVAVLTPQPADFSTDIYDLVVQLQQTVTG